LYLPFRALGDFVITAAIVKKHSVSKIPVLLPSYLKDLFFELGADHYFDIKGYVNFPQYPKIFEIHKLKTIKDLLGYIRDYRIIASINKKPGYVVDAHCKRLFLSGLKFLHPPADGHIYETRLKFLASQYNFKNDAPDIRFSEANIRRVVIFPGSRMKSKEIDFEVVKQIGNYFESKNVNVTIAYHTNEVPGDQDNTLVTKFTNFKELKQLIEKNDFIISADSLPIHFAYYLNKPHYCLYNTVTNDKWLTPPALNDQFFSVITEGEIYGAQIFNKIKDKGYQFNGALLTNKIQ